MIVGFTPLCFPSVSDRWFTPLSLPFHFLFTPLKSKPQNHQKRTDETDAEAADHLSERVLTENHPRRADQSRHNENQAEPPHGIERPLERIGDECAREAADGRRMGRDFPPDIDDGADDLNRQRRQENPADDVRNMDGVHRVVTREIADDGDDIRHHSPLFPADFVGMPTLRETVETDE